MSITLDLKPELEARVLEDATAQGLPVEEYVATILERALLPLPCPPRRISLEEFDAAMDGIAAGSDGLVAPPVFTREEIYGDHD